MRRFRIPWLLGICLLPFIGTAESEPQSAASIEWQPWSESLFADAQRQHKFVLLDLQAVWCHWCHVMDEKTYRDPKVIALINAHYIAVRVDQDSRPDLANRYEDYGWPATVVYQTDGSEIVKRSGYLPPEQMASMLQAIIDDPSPGPSVVNQNRAQPNGTPSLSDPMLQELKKQFAQGYDDREGGWGTTQKFLNWDNVEYCLDQARQGNAEAERMARQTLAAQLKLIDPIWGGVDQYSAGDDWDHPHFEKIMQMQAENMRLYAEAYALWKDPVYLQAARRIYGYVRRFLTSPDGVVYVSQDADLVAGQHAGAYFLLDDAGRRKLGIPAIDKHIYARENGWFIEALTALYASSGETRYRDEAVRAAMWIIQNRAAPGGGFRHGQEPTSRLYLGDNLAMGRAFLRLYSITADPVWLERSRQTAAFIDEHFSYKPGDTPIGFATSSGDSSATAGFTPQPEFDENVSLARFTNLLFHYTGDRRDRGMAETAMRFISSPDLAHARFSSVGGLLLAAHELSSDPLHIAIVGARKDAIAETLFQTAVATPGFYQQIEWIDSGRPSPSQSTFTYPATPNPAAYLCVDNSCSAPVFDRVHLLHLLELKTSAKATPPGEK